jgi:3-oxoacyl-[acyl-carrier-protein] synthase III
MNTPRPARDQRIRIPWSATRRSAAITGTGAYLPDRVLTNADLEKMVDTTDEWISSRTGIKERRVARPDQAASDLAREAAVRALENAGLPAAEVEMIVVASITPDMIFPSTACFVQHLIGAPRAFCMDIQAACSGFLYALNLAHHHVASGAVNNALIIGAEKLSCVLDWKDRATCVLFGDGAGAAVVQPCRSGKGVLSSVLGADGSLSNLLMLPGGGSRHPASEQTLRDGMHFLKMSGRDVFKHAVTRMTQAAKDALEKCGLGLEDVDLLIPHQANLRIIDAIGERLGIPREKCFLTIEKYGNMSAASIAVALDEASRSGRLKKGDVVLMIAFGGGFTWGATVMEWEK